MMREESHRTPKTWSTYVVTSHIYLRQFEESLAICACLDDRLENQVHPGVARDEVTVKCLAIFQLYEHWMPLSGGEKT